MSYEEAVFTYTATPIVALAVSKTTIEKERENWSLQFLSQDAARTLSKFGRGNESRRSQNTMIQRNALNYTFFRQTIRESVLHKRGSYKNARRKTQD